MSESSTESSAWAKFFGFVVIVVAVIALVSVLVAINDDYWREDVREGCYVHTVTNNRVWWSPTDTEKTQTLYCEKTA